MTRRLSALDREISNIVDAIAERCATPAMKKKLLSLEKEKVQVERERADHRPPPRRS
jgi:hypothetical protein